MHDLGGGAARFDKLGPWHRNQLLANAVGAIRAMRPLPLGKWLIGCNSEAQQSKLARLETLPGDFAIGARVPRLVVDGVVGPISKGRNELQLVRQDLEAGGVGGGGVSPRRCGDTPQQQEKRVVPGGSHFLGGHRASHRSLARVDAVQCTGLRRTSTALYQVPVTGVY